ncbi:MAG TPA: sigma-70 family RNA polymerase sigma factor [Planctomycetes bacterium]|nr:sigma-70 family RNA polymerase sigma factor [Planctomycetota bacterium]
MTDDIEKLVALARAGDREALETLFERFRSRIQGVVRKRLGENLRKYLESSDVVQSVCLEAMNGIDRLGPADEDGFVRWLARIAENTIRDKHRYFTAKKRHPDNVPDGRGGYESLSQTPDAGATPSGAVGAREEMEAVLAALARLPEDYRRVIELTRFDKLSHEEAAAAMGRTEKGTRMLLARARVRLLEELRKGRPTDGD